MYRIGQKVKVISTEGDHHSFKLGQIVTIIAIEIELNDLLRQDYLCGDGNGFSQYMRECEILPTFETYLNQAELCVKNTSL